MNRRNTSIIHIVSYFLSIFFLNILSCSNSPDKGNVTNVTNNVNSIGYDLNNPDKTFVLPLVLHEISGIAVIDSSSVACVQDENGIVFIYDVRKKGITDQVTFHGNGDYEGITKANSTIYVLRSDGTLFLVNNLKYSDPAEEIRLKELPRNNYEGLCYDRKNNRLLIAPKEKINNSHETAIKHGIYGFDLKKGMPENDPVIGFDLSAIKRFAAENNVFPRSETGKKDKGNKPQINFSPSAIGIHPVTGKLFLLSSADRMLFVFDMNGTIEYMTRLDPEIFNMSEGITFFENGDMLISNEGQNGNATLLRFKYKE